MLHDFLCCVVMLAASATRASKFKAMEWKTDGPEHLGIDNERAVCDLQTSATCPENGALAAFTLLARYNHFRAPQDIHSMVGPLLATLPLPPPPLCLPPYCQHIPVRNTPLHPCEDVRRRGEKRPIPPELKDEKYFERRRRNNQAAKKSRDARRIREDQIAWRACILEQENASLRAHVAALRQETLTLRGLLAAREEPPAPSSTTPD